jgi:hypothetical protein
LLGINWNFEGLMGKRGGKRGGVKKERKRKGGLQVK